MEFRQLEYFVSLAQAKTFSKAADQVHVSQPALSQGIQKLEEELDVQLVERMGKQIKLTSEGEKFLPEARSVLDAVRSAESAVDSGADGLDGTLRLGVIPTIAPYFLPTLINRLEPDENNLEVEVEEQQTDPLLNQLKIGKVDHLLLSPPIPEEGLTITSVGEEPFYLAVHADESLAERDAISVDRISDEPILLLEEGHCLRDQTLSFCQRNKFSPNVVFQGSSLQSILNLIASGYGYTFVPEMVVEGRSVPGVRYVPITDPTPSREIILVRRDSTDLTEFEDHVYDVVERWFGGTE